MAERARHSGLTVAVLGALAALVVCLGVAALDVAVPATAGAQPSETTTTQPVDDQDFGEIIPRPNSGRPPEHPGDRGGWQQLALFFVILAAIAAIAVAVWWSSRRARRRREAEGTDPLSLAKARGEGLRRPRD